MLTLTSLIALSIVLSFIVFYYILMSNRCINKGLTPISLSMAVHHEHAKFRVRYKNLDENSNLYKLGIRSGQFGVILKATSGMYAKTTVDGKCKFIPIESCNYIPT